MKIALQKRSRATHHITATKLEIGDVIQHGNQIIGFYYTTVIGIEKPAGQRMRIVEQFEHGGSGGHWVGKNAEYYVVRSAA